MKICVINLRASSLYLTESEEIFGGAEIESYMLGKLFRRLGHEVHVILSPEQSTLNCKEREPGHFKLHQLHKSGQIARLQALWLKLSEVSPDLVFIKIISESSALVASWCRLNGRAFVYRAANRRDLLLASGKGDYSLKQRLFFWLTCHRKATIVTQTEEQHEAFRRHFPPGQLHCIGNYMESSGISPAPFNQRKGVLWAGHLMPVKRPEQVLELAEALPDVPFILVASTASWIDTSEIMARIRSLPNVEFLPNVPFHKMNQIFSRVRILLNTSISEGFPNTFLQAMDQGLPIATSGVNPGRLITENDLGIVEGDLTKLKEWIKRIHGNEEEWNEITIKVKSAGSAQFGENNYIAKYSAILSGN
jgi:glycosyltransferase involved in cell wall biosynthesis